MLFRLTLECLDAAPLQQSTRATNILWKLEWASLSRSKEVSRGICSESAWSPPEAARSMLSAKYARDFLVSALHCSIKDSTVHHPRFPTLVTHVGPSLRLAPCQQRAALPGAYSAQKAVFPLAFEVRGIVRVSGSTAYLGRKHRRMIRELGQHIWRLWSRNSR